MQTPEQRCGKPTLEGTEPQQPAPLASPESEPHLELDSNLQAAWGHSWSWQSLVGGKELMKNSVRNHQQVAHNY